MSRRAKSYQVGGTSAQVLLHQFGMLQHPLLE